MQSTSVRLWRRPEPRELRPSASAMSLVNVFLFVCLGTGPLLAQASPQKTVWDGAYTDAQATRGLSAFSQSCSGCHAVAAGGRAPLVGDPFWKSFAQKNVGELLDYVSKYMPNGNPASLSENTYDDIVAYMLKTNGFPAGNTEVGRTASAGFEIIQKGGGTALPDDALVHVVGCLAKSGSGWVVTKATSPERAERAAAGQDATESLGTRTMALKFVLTRLDPWAGSRIAVDGLLIGADGAGGLNVTTVNRVAPKCP